MPISRPGHTFGTFYRALPYSVTLNKRDLTVKNREYGVLATFRTVVPPPDRLLQQIAYNGEIHAGDKPDPRSTNRRLFLYNDGCMPCSDWHNYAKRLDRLCWIRGSQTESSPSAKTDSDGPGKLVPDMDPHADQIMIRPEFHEWVCSLPAEDNPRGDFIRETIDCVMTANPSCADLYDAIEHACDAALFEHERLLDEYQRKYGLPRTYTTCPKCGELAEREKR